VEAFSRGNESEETDSGTCNNTPFQNFGSIALKQRGKARHREGAWMRRVSRL